MKKKTTERTGTFSRQALYMSILISLTIGFVLGAAYTSFKLAGESSGTPIHDHSSPAPGPKNPSMAAGGPPPDMDDRIAELENLVQQHPEDARAWAQLGHAYFDLDQPDKAIQAYEKSMALAPGDPAVLTDMGVMYRRRGEPDKAIQAFDQAVAASPGFETALFNKGVVLMADLNDLPGAMAAWKELVKVNPDATTPGGEKVADIVARMASQN
jgi:cytochrome c-type biogenesis protein CcmH/NrfG